MFGVYVVVFFPNLHQSKVQLAGFLSVIKSYLANGDLISF